MEDPWWGIPAQETKKVGKQDTLEDDDFEVRFVVPPAVKRHLRSLFANIDDLRKTIGHLEEYVGTKAGKTEVLTALEGKADAGSLKADVSELQKRVNEVRFQAGESIKVLETSVNVRIDEVQSKVAEYGESVGTRLGIFERSLGTLEDSVYRVTEALDVRAEESKQSLSSALVETNSKFTDLESRVDSSVIRVGKELEELSARVVTLEEPPDEIAVATQQQLDAGLQSLKKTIDAVSLRVSRSEEESSKSQRIQSTIKEFVDERTKGLEERLKESNEAVEGLRAELADQKKQTLSALSSMQGLEKMVKTLEISVSGLLMTPPDQKTVGGMDATELASQFRDELGTIIADLSKMRRDVRGMQERVESQEESTKKQFSDVHDGIDSLTSRVSDVEGDSATAMDALRRDVESTTSIVRELRAGHGELNQKFGGAMRDMSTIREMFDKRLAHFDGRLQEASIGSMGAVDEAVESLSEALMEETEARTKAHEEILKMLHHLRMSIRDEVGQKADWWEVQKSLWRKIDRSETPMGFSVQSGIQPDGPLQHRCLSCDAPPPPQPPSEGRADPPRPGARSRMQPLFPARSSSSAALLSDRKPNTHRVRKFRVDGAPALSRSLTMASGVYGGSLTSRDPLSRHHHGSGSSSVTPAQRAWDKSWKDDLQ
eukprot:TRINITY_DN82809_c0_g1_i1.p1 TRINITY_DN82809_c0_g1~~TRINITY_DN82809_c0_g1_i1.p1  ORF type:complete len:659 (-),score=209.84 TRINITY_DN82809_c0_g1_i1:92-2068(-)